MTPRTIIGIIILMALLVLSQLFLTSPERLPRQAGELEPPVEGYYVDDAVMDQRDVNGNSMYRLKADRIEDLPRDDRVLLTNVEIEYPGGEAGAGWDLTADHGEISLDGQQIMLRDNVRARELGDTGLRLIRTSVLEFDVANSIASTTAEVLVELDGKRLSATGMIADLKASTVELQSTVNAHFEP